MGVKKDAGVVSVNEAATVVTADQMASNGVVHIIDTVLMPPNIVELAQSVDSLSTLVQAVTAGDLAGDLSGAGPFTVFAPNNAAFDKLPAGTVDNLLQPASKAQLVGILKYHVLDSQVL